MMTFWGNAMQEPESMMSTPEADPARIPTPENSLKPDGAVPERVPQDEDAARRDIPSDEGTDNTRLSTDEAQSPSSASSEPARSPAEAFAELAAQIAQARRDIAQVADYARGTGAQLQRAYSDVFLQGADAAVRGLIRIDELLFKQTRENATSHFHPETAALATMLGQALEGELRAIDVQVLEPQPGDELDLARMVAIANRPTPLLRGRRAGTIAEIISRGYLFASPDREQILKKAEVVIWRHRDDVAFDAIDKTETTRGDSDE
jgi:molecular chaperone GrpE (heat shock protein)